MSLAFLRIHFLRERESKEDALGYRLTACGRLAPTWARRTTDDPDFVTCESCLKILTGEILESLHTGIAASQDSLNAAHILKDEYGCTHKE